MGTHIVSWMQKLDIPLFISNRQLMKRKGLNPALGAWCLDSGGFSELSLFSEWRTTPREYVQLVNRYVEEIGNLVWAAPQDWMCEPVMLQKTQSTVTQHQIRTVENYLVLRTLNSDLPFIPVLQGWSRDEYMRCWELYEWAGVSLLNEDVVGVGSVCRRQGTKEGGMIFESLAQQGLALHGFGVKITGLKNYASSLVSADSLAWSRGARYSPPLPGHTHPNCANCLEYALKWRNSLVEEVGWTQ